MTEQFTIGIDVGGTFTDIVLRGGSGKRVMKKVPSTHHSYADAILSGVHQLIAMEGLPKEAISSFMHASTVASNTILERKGARTGLITTRGFRDILEIRNLRMPRLYDMSWTKPKTLVERFLRVEVDERINANGEIERPLEEEDVERAIRRLIEHEVEVISVCLLHSYQNPVHEQVIKKVAGRIDPSLIVCASSDVLPEINEYTRTSTTVINSYLKPIIREYLEKLSDGLTGAGMAAPLWMMQSTGDLASAKLAVQRPVTIVESGPAAGVIGVQALSMKAGLSKALSFDMGGTTAKVSIIEDGKVSRASEYEVGGGANIGTRLLSGGGYPLKVPAIDLAEVGAGGGSIIWLDAAGSIQVGPESAGASPGPVCYGFGGVDPTVTDANVVLGFLNPLQLVGGEVTLHADKALDALRHKIADPLGITFEQAAYGAHLIAAANMIRAIKAVTSERGRDPREYTLVAFGGNGPLFASTLARSLKIGRVIVPPLAGVFSSMGLLFGQVGYYATRTVARADMQGDTPERIEGIFQELQAEVSGLLLSDGFSDIETTRSASLRYQGQAFEMEVPLPSAPFNSGVLRDARSAFAAEHETTYGYRGGDEEPVEIVTLRVFGRTTVGDREPASVPRPPNGSAVANHPVRQVYFGPEWGWVDTPILKRADLTQPRRGSCIIEEYDSTTVVPPDAEVYIDDIDNIVINLKSDTQIATEK